MARGQGIREDNQSRIPVAELGGLVERGKAELAFHQRRYTKKVYMCLRWIGVHNRLVGCGRECIDARDGAPVELNIATKMRLSCFSLRKRVLLMRLSVLMIGI